MTRGLAILLLASALSWSCDEKAGTPATEAGPKKAPSAQVQAGRALFESRCTACHTIGDGDRTGPDLKDVAKRRTHEWLLKWIKNPEQMGGSDHIGKQLAARYGDIIMPNPNLTDAEIEQVLAFISDSSERGGYEAPSIPARKLEGAELAKAENIFFDRCAGCHGSMRQGGVGPAITPERTQSIGTTNLIATLNHGRAGGMPAWGEFGILSAAEVQLLAHYLQMPPVARQQLSLDEMKKSWNLKSPLAERPSKPEHTRNWKNFFAVVMRGSGMVAIIDGDKKEKLTLLDVGFAAHSVRASASGRYLYALARDGRITLVDLWTDPPLIAAQARGCFDARSLEVSKGAAQSDRLLIEGCYWPPQFVVLDGRTLEPRYVETVAQADAGVRYAEVRVGSIVAPRDKTVWALSLIDSGSVAIVDYSKPSFALSARIPAEPGVLNGALDASGRYFVLPAPKSKLVVLDLTERKLVARVATGKKPYLDRGARFEHSDLGKLIAVPQLDDDRLDVIGADPEGKPDKAWKVVRQVKGVARGGLSVRTHEKSKWLWVDSPANPNPELTRQVCVVAKNELSVEKCFKPMDRGRVVQFEFNQAGTEVWVAGSDPKGAIIVYDDASLKEVARIEADWVKTPLGMYNVFNTAGDVY